MQKCPTRLPFWWSMGETLGKGIGGKGGAKDKEKVTSPFPPSLWLWKYGKPAGFTTFPQPPLTPFFPSDFLPVL